jgi:S1/P1 Nuclease
MRFSPTRTPLTDRATTSAFLDRVLSSSIGTAPWSVCKPPLVVACLTVLVAVGAFVRPLEAWNGRGHMLVAFIAYQHLNAQAKAAVDSLLTLNPQHETWLEALPSNASQDRRALTAFLEASVWPDFIRSAPTYISDGPNGGNTPPNTPEASQNIGYKDLFRHKYWHFINVPFSDDGTTTTQPPLMNAQSEIETFRKALGSSSTSADVKSYDLVWLLHLVGDVHQPLHAVARFTKSDPDGDSGGNDVNVQCPVNFDCQDTLHTEWDHLLGEITSISSLSATAKSIDSSGAPAGATNTNVATWIDESVALAKSDVYKTTSGGRLNAPNASLNAQYMSRARADARGRVRLAAHRLANLINTSLGH